MIKIQGLQHILLDHLPNHIIGRNDHVIAAGPAGQLAIHRFIGVIGLVIDLDPGFGRKVV